MRYLKSKTAVFVYAIAVFCFLSFNFQKNTFFIFPSKNVSMANSFLLFGIFVIFQWIAKYWKNAYGKIIYVLMAILCILFSYMTFMGKYYSSKPKMGLSDILLENGGTLRALLCFLGGCLLFFFGFLGIGSLKEWLRQKSPSQHPAALKIQNFLFGKHCFLKQCIILAICWLPHVIIRYPGALGADAFNALAQYYGKMEYTTQHPIVYTYLIGTFTDLGLKLGNGEYGLFALILLQTAAMLLVLAYCINTMRKIGFSHRFCFVVMIAFCLMPNIIAFATTAIIDSLYDIAFLLLMIELLYYLYFPETYKKSWKHLLLTFLAVSGTFFRYNGLYIVVIMFVLISGREIFLLFKKKQTPVYSIKIILLLLIPIVSGKMLVTHLNTACDSVYVSERSKLAIPIQQISRYMVYYGDTDVTPEEMETIQKVLAWNVEDYREKYDPYCFDNIKGGFQNDATSEEMKEFFKVWGRLFLRHPKIYIDAVVNQTYLLFSPIGDNYRYYIDSQKLAVKESYDFTELFVGNSENEFWTDLQAKLLDYYQRFHRFPFLGLLVNQGCYTFLLLGICMYALVRKKGLLLFFSMPLLLTLGIAFVGPAVLFHPRYTFPIMYSMPLFFGMFLFGRKADNRFEDKNSVK